MPMRCKDTFFFLFQVNLTFFYQYNRDYSLKKRWLPIFAAKIETIGKTTKENFSLFEVIGEKECFIFLKTINHVSFLIVSHCKVTHYFFIKGGHLKKFYSKIKFVFY